MPVKELPIACTLTPSAMADRVEWLRTAGRHEPARRRAPSTAALQLRFDPAAEDEVRAWVRAEQECCAFLSFELDRDDARAAPRGRPGPEGAEPVLDGPARRAHAG